MKFQHLQENVFRLVKEDNGESKKHSNTYKKLAKFLIQSFGSKYSDKEDLLSTIDYVIWWFGDKYDLDSLCHECDWRPDVDDRPPDDPYYDGWEWQDPEGRKTMVAMYKALKSNFGNSEALKRLQQKKSDKLFSGKNYYLQVIDKVNKRVLGSVIEKEGPEGVAISYGLHKAGIKYDMFKWDEFQVLYFPSQSEAKKASSVLSHIYPNLVFMPLPLVKTPFPSVNERAL